MRYRRLAKTELTLSEVGFGVWTVSSRDWGVRSRDAAERLLQRAFDLGVTFFDIADVTGEGEGERVLAEALRGQRHDVVIATKAGYDWYTPPHLRPSPDTFAQDWRPDYIREACESSLKRLNTDYIDLYQLHHPGMGAVEDDALFDTLATLGKEGKIRYWGVALRSGEGADEEGEMTLKERDVRTLQIPYSMLEHDVSRRLSSLAVERGAGIIARDVHAGGLLGGAPAVATAPWDEGGSSASRQPDRVSKMHELHRLTERYSMTLAQIALKFVLADPAVVSVLPNVTSEQALAEFAAAAELPELAAEDVAAVTES